MQRPIKSYLYGLPALFAELQDQGVKRDSVFRLAGLRSDQVLLSREETLAVFRSAQQLSVRPETALLAGYRQELDYYGPYGYALASSATIRDAFKLSANIFALSGSVLRISFRIDGERGIFQSHEPEALGTALPFVAEYWRASQTKLLSLVLGQAFPSLHMYFTYPEPRYKQHYSEILRCPVSFGADAMEWHFDARILGATCSKADLHTARFSQIFCDAIIRKIEDISQFQKDILRACLPHLSTRIQAEKIASQLGVSRRTFFRRLAQEGTTFQSLLDRARASIALEYLSNTDLSIEDIGTRCGYQDPSNFRKAFLRWKGAPPSTFRMTSSDRPLTGT
ncbi:MAG: AraC family transcriptional regulator ligand-binding domain-containing protein [Pseudomonadota bacterium]